MQQKRNAHLCDTHHAKYPEVCYTVPTLVLQGLLILITGCIAEVKVG